MTTTAFQATAQAIAYTLGEPPERVDWAEAVVYGDGEIRYFDALDEEEARQRARRSAGRLPSVGGAPGEADVVRTFPAHREVRKLRDGTQLISPWLEAEGK